MKYFIFLVSIASFLSCNDNKTQKTVDSKIDSLAEAYVRLGLEIGKYDADFVDAYYGPDSFKGDTTKETYFPKDSLLARTERLILALQLIPAQLVEDSIKVRALWISKQLLAFKRRIKIFSGEKSSFDEEAKSLFGDTAPVYDEEHYKAILASLEHELPGEGDVIARFQQLGKKFIIPKNKLDTVFKTAIAEARRRTLEHFTLPANENFKLEYVTAKPWSGYNWYKGNYQSLIQINIDGDIFIERALDLACHEGYPGHHVYNCLLEKNLYNDRKYIEVSFYPLFSPQSLIAEGSANYGIEVAFPKEEKVKFIKEVLLPLAGLDTTGATVYMHSLEAKAKLNFARNEAGRGLINGTMTELQAQAWLEKYCLMNTETALKSIRFIMKYRSYIINYNFGQQLVSNYIEKKTGGDIKKRWEAFGYLLSNEISTSDLK